MARGRIHGELIDVENTNTTGSNNESIVIETQLLSLLKATWR